MSGTESVRVRQGSNIICGRKVSGFAISLYSRVVLPGDNTQLEVGSLNNFIFPEKSNSVQGGIGGENMNMGTRSLHGAFR